MLRDSGLTWTFLRDSFYADVLLDFAGEERVIRGPGGTGRCAFVARRDVAEVAARILRDPAPWANRALELTGPVAVSLAEAALLMTRARGEEYEYVDETLAEARASRAARSEEHTSELQSRFDLVCRLLLEKKKQ